MSELNTRILVEIRDTLRSSDRRLGNLERGLAETNERLSRVELGLAECQQNLGVLAHITQGIDRRLERIEERESDRVFLPQRVTALEERVDRLEAERES